MITPFASEYYEISFVLILAAFAIPISRKMAIADIPILIVLGILFGPVLGIINHTFAINFLTNFGYVGIGLLGIMIILYYESHHLDLKIIRRHFWRILSLDTIGIIVTAVVGGVIFSVLTGAPFAIGFLFGAVISPTDPVTLIPLFRRIRIKDDISGTLVGESLFNDPLGIILVTIAIVLIDPTASYVSLFSTISSHVGVYAGTIVYLLAQIIIPSIIGIIIGFSMIFLNRFLNFENLLVALLLGVVILEFTILEAAGLTPFPAIIATGAIVGNFSDKSIFWNREQNFQENLSFLSQAIIFLLLGSILTEFQLTNYIVLGFILTLLMILLVRPAAVFASLMAVRKKGSALKTSNRLNAFFSLVGPRGVVSVVMSTVPYSVGVVDDVPILLQYGPLISVMVSFVVLFSIILQTIYVPFLAKYLSSEWIESV
ncbi:MAG: cation:proton antiporter [Thermoplasmataceae archaeon]|jgi:NhaP-type Na+/H+ or K+/H+ antiporter|nr:sodium:proton antiporter [Candidatus Thermoplasmatota archaeon]